MLVLRKVGMNHLGDVPEQPAHRVRRESRLGSRSRICGEIYRLALFIEPPGNLTELEFGNAALEFLELLVQETDVPSIAETERRNVGPRTPDFSGAFGDRRFEFGKAAGEITVFPRWSRSNETAHASILSNYLMRPAVRKRR